MVQNNPGNSAEKKRPLGHRIGKHIGDRARLLGEFGDDVVNRPKVLPGKAHGIFRQWFAKVWRIRGGGLYACGFAVTFAIFEIRMIIEDFTGGSDLRDLFNGEIIQFFVNFMIDSLMNTVHALMWPVYVVQLSPPYGAIGLGIAFIIFANFLKKPIEGWLFANEADPDSSG